MYHFIRLCFNSIRSPKIRFIRLRRDYGQFTSGPSSLQIEHSWHLPGLSNVLNRVIQSLLVRNCLHSHSASLDDCIAAQRVRWYVARFGREPDDNLKCKQVDDSIQ